MSSYNIRYRFRNKETGELLQWTDGSSMLLNKKGAVCITPPNNTRMRNQWRQPDDKFVLEVATSKRDGEWLYKPVVNVKETYSLSYLFNRLSNIVKGVFQ